ncbi:Pumilio-family RNA binding repeat protein [Nitzschia inconspicua]|uniref:Pumilio-family RNA binding repeat protein n=1 Tax=Nitzschia inconspicua TaxID=303405 RepID=A0A9K3LGL2_9STRA|nr:Pumilio-family RNA binding repeat protein [Nitzschia inconspicua]
METPWQTDFHYRQEDYDVRSTSAPPPETSFLFSGGDSNRYNHHERLDSLLGSSFTGSDGQTLGTPYRGSNNSSVRHQDPPFVTDSPYSSSNRRSPAPPGFAASDYLSSSLESRNKQIVSPNISRQFPEPDPRNLLGSFDRRFIGENLVRSQSAAPSFDGGMSMGPPPGLARRETPLVSNRSSGSSTMVTTQRDSYLDASVDRSHILQLGQRRPASTGVIGGNQTSSSTVLHSLGLGSGTGAVRPAAKTLMDLIQEDFPPETPSLDAGDFYGTNFQRENAYTLERPRTTSPLSSQYNSLRSDHFLYPGQDDSELLDSSEQLRFKNRDESPYIGQNGFARQRPSPQYPSVERMSAPEQGVGMYSPMTSHPSTSRTPQPLRNGQHHQQQQHQLQDRLTYEQTNSHFGGHPTQPVQSQIHAHVLPSGHTVFINSSSPHPYQGYATIQYHPHSQQHHMIHQTGSNGISRQPNEQFISVVPIQGGGHLQGGGPGGTYTYWQPPDGQPGGPQIVTILPPGAGGMPNVESHIGTCPSGTPTSQKQRHQNQQRNQSHGGRGKDRAGKGRKNGGTNPGRKNATAEAKHPATNGHTQSLSLLDEYKSKKNNREWTVIDIQGHVVEFCKDQNGSRFVQQRLELGSDEEKEIVMSEALPMIDQLRNDVFGNYVVQKLFDFGSDKMKHDLRDTLTGEMVSLSMQMYGCRVIQKALEQLDDGDLPGILSELHNNVLNLIHDQNGNHVIQKCIEVMCEKARHAVQPSQSALFTEQIDFIFDDVLHNVASLSCHPYGCRVLQRILEFSEDPKKGLILDEIIKCKRTLLDDQYGNYVIQHVLQFGRTEDRDKVLDMVVENGLLKLSRQKFASNVVEKLLKYGNAEQRRAVARQMLRLVNEKTGTFIEEGEHGTSVVLLMVRDAYANYVVQTTLDVIPDSEEKTNLLKELSTHSPELKNYTFAKHILTKIS